MRQKTLQKAAQGNGEWLNPCQLRKTAKLAYVAVMKPLAIALRGHPDNLARAMAAVWHERPECIPGAWDDCAATNPR